MGQGLVGETIRQLTLSFGKIVSLVQDDRGVALIGGEDEDAGVLRRDHLNVYMTPLTSFLALTFIYF